jgi:hypothetical protein
VDWRVAPSFTHPVAIGFCEKLQLFVPKRFPGERCLAAFVTGIVIAAATHSFDEAYASRILILVA